MENQTQGGHNGRPWERWLPLAAVCALALGLRLWGISFGLPHLYHADEWRLVMPALEMLHTGDLNPHEFLYGSLPRYLLAGLYALYAVYGRWTGVLATVNDLPVFGYATIRDVYAYPVPAVYLLGRALIASLGALTAGVVYLVGQRVMGRRGGFIAGLALAVSPLHVVHSHFITADVLMAFFVVLSVLFSLQVARHGARTAYALAGLMVGLATAAKYPGALAGLPLVAAHFLGPPTQRRASYLLVGIVAAAASYLVVTPFVVLDFPTWWAGIGRAWTVYDLPGRAVEGSSGRWYLSLLFGPPHTTTSIAAGLGLAAMLWRRERAAWLIVALLIPYLIILSAKTARVPRTMVAVMPFLALLSAYGVMVVASWARDNWRSLPGSRGWITALIVAFVLGLAGVRGGRPCSKLHAARSTHADPALD